MEIIEDSSVKFTHIAAHTARRQIPPQARHPLHILCLDPAAIILAEGGIRRYAWPSGIRHRHDSYHTRLLRTVLHLQTFRLDISLNHPMLNN